MATEREDLRAKKVAETGEYWPKEGEKTAGELVISEFAKAAGNFLDAIENLDYFEILETLNQISKWQNEVTEIIDDIISWLRTDYIEENYGNIYWDTIDEGKR